MTHPSPTALEEIRKRSLADDAWARTMTANKDRSWLLTHIAALEAQLATRLPTEESLNGWYDEHAPCSWEDGSFGADLLASGLLSGAATAAPTAALTEDAPTTTDEGPKPKYGEFYAADLPEEQQYRKAVQVVIKEQKASTSFIQRHLQIGYNRAARLLERMVVEGICTEPNGVGKRTVLQPEVKPGQIDVMEF